MAQYNPPLRDSHFILHELLQIHNRDDIEGYSELTEDITTAIFEEAGKISSEILLPLNEVGDKEGDGRALMSKKSMAVRACPTSSTALSASI